MVSHLQAIPAAGRRVIQGVDACQRFSIPVLWRPYLGRQCVMGEGGREAGMETPAQRSYAIRLRLARIGGPLLCCRAAREGGRKGLYG